MKHAITIALGLMVALAVGTLLWPGSAAQAQSGCKDFQALVQAWLPTSTPLAPTDTWGGPLFGFLGGELLPGVLSGNDGNETFRQHMGAGRGGAYTVCVGYPTCTDSFTYEVPNAVFPIPPGKGGIVPYFGNTAKIVSGTGRFQAASGNLNVSGPAIVWPDSSSPFGVSGRWNPAISGRVCGVQ
jgi:hypothetical protein